MKELKFQLLMKKEDRTKERSFFAFFRAFWREKKHLKIHTKDLSWIRSTFIHSLLDISSPISPRWFLVSQRHQTNIQSALFTPIAHFDLTVWRVFVLYLSIAKICHLIKFNCWMSKRKHWNRPNIERWNAHRDANEKSNASILFDVITMAIACRSSSASSHWFIFYWNSCFNSSHSFQMTSSLSSFWLLIFLCLADVNVIWTFGVRANHAKSLCPEWRMVELDLSLCRFVSVQRAQ